MLQGDLYNFHIGITRYIERYLAIMSNYCCACSIQVEAIANWHAKVDIEKFPDKHSVERIIRPVSPSRISLRYQLGNHLLTQSKD